jgi:putative intracellular protease/amidase
MDRRHFMASGTALGLVACAAAPRRAALVAPGEGEHRENLEGLRPPKRTRPVVAVLGSPFGAETTDLLVPYGVLVQSGLSVVRVVSSSMAVVPLMPALTIRPQMSLEAFDAEWPDGADYVIVPAMHRDNDPVTLAWLQAQSAGGAVVCAICAGAIVLSKAGLIGDRRATTHWYRVDELQRANPAMTLVRDRRYVVDRGVSTTTGVSASVPFSLTLVEAIGGSDAAAAVACRMGVTSWGAAHDSAAFRLTRDAVFTAVRNRVAFLDQDRIGVPVADGVDEIALSLVSDVYSKTYRSQGFAVAEGNAEITTRGGLVLLPSAGEGMDWISAPFADWPPAEALDLALRDITARYGASTARFAALTLELPWEG